MSLKWKERQVRKLALAAAGAATLFVIIPITTASAVFQVQSVTVALCHATTIGWNPYQYVTVVVDSNDAAHTVGGHASHTGPIYDAHAPQDSWGDIIPPFTYGDFSYPGLNWTTKGQLVFHGHNHGHPNGCVDDLEYPPTTSPTPTSPPPTTTPPTTTPPTHHSKPPTSPDVPQIGGINGGTAFTGGDFTKPFFALLTLALAGLGAYELIRAALIASQLVNEDTSLSISGVSVEELVPAIRTADVGRLTKIPGVAFAEWGPGDMAFSLGVKNGPGPMPPAMQAARAKVFAADAAINRFYRTKEADQR
jgi:hypothetical protein